MAWVCMWCSKSNWNTRTTCWGCKLTPEQARAECASCIPQAEPIGKAPAPKTSVPTLPPWSGAKGQRGSRPLMREYLPRSHGHGPYQERPPDPPQAPRVLDDSDVGWVDVAGRPFPRVAPAAIGRRPIASTMHGTVHSMASMGLEGYAGAKGAGGARKNPSSKGKCGAKGGRPTDKSFSHTVSLEQTLPPQTGWLDQSCPAPAVFDGRQDKGSARSAFPPRPPGVMETPPREL